MRTLCPNLDREDGLETVLEVPIPEEIFATSKNSPWHNMKSWVKSQYTNKSGSNNNNNNSSVIFGSRSTELQLLLGVVGAPLVPQAICSDHSFFSNSFRNHPIEASMAKYIVKQYIAAAGGETALNSIDSMYAMGKVKIATTEVVAGDGLSSVCNNNNLNSPGKAAAKMKTAETAGEVGGFVLWQKKPDLWSLELVVSGCKISAGSDGKVAWRQTPWHHSHASRGPPRPLRRSVQGVDPRSTAKLFSNSICTGEKSINDEDCFVLKLEVDPSSLKSRSSRTVEILRHTVYGYFSQRTGLLIQLEDTHLLRIKSPGNDVFWETTMESSILDYRTIDGVNIAHSGKTTVTLFRFGENSDEHTRTRMEEVWNIVEVDFNIKGLSVDCFLPPADLKRGDEEYGVDVRGNAATRNSKSPFKIRPNNNTKYTMCATKVVAIDDDDVGIIEADEVL